jgi:hypothetical protein
MEKIKNDEKEVRKPNLSKFNVEKKDNSRNKPIFAKVSKRKKVVFKKTPQFLPTEPPTVNEVPKKINRCKSEKPVTFYNQFLHFQPDFKDSSAFVKEISQKKGLLYLV